jgi:hypothetical protein
VDVSPRILVFFVAFSERFSICIHDFLKCWLHRNNWIVFHGLAGVLEAKKIENVQSLDDILWICVWTIAHGKVWIEWGVTSEKEPLQARLQNCLSYEDDPASHRAETDAFSMREREQRFQDQSSPFQVWSFRYRRAPSCGWTFQIKSHRTQILRSIQDFNPNNQWITLSVNHHNQEGKSQGFGLWECQLNVC